MTPNKPHPQLSVLVPCYNEKDCLQSFLDEVCPALDALNLTWEILFIDDGSTDATVTCIEQAHQRDSRIKGIGFSRNFGKEAAITCGLHSAQGDGVLIMDVDLQHPTDLIAELVRLWREEGFDMVVPLNESRRTENVMKRALSRLYYRALRMISTVPILPGGSDFRLLDRKVVEAIKQLPERTRFMKGIYAWPGFRVTTFPYEVRPRREGSTKWKLRCLWKLSLDGIFGFSTLPLRLWTYIGFVIAFLSFLRALWIGARALIYGPHVAHGVTTVAVFLFFLIGLLMVSNGLLGEYLARVYEEVKGRPLYIIATQIGYEEDDA